MWCIWWKQKCSSENQYFYVWSLKYRFLGIVLIGEICQQHLIVSKKYDSNVFIIFFFFSIVVFGWWFHFELKINKIIFWKKIINLEIKLGQVLRILMSDWSKEFFIICPVTVCKEIQIEHKTTKVGRGFFFISST